MTSAAITSSPVLEFPRSRPLRTEARKSLKTHICLTQVKSGDGLLVIGAGKGRPRSFQLRSPSQEKTVSIGNLRSLDERLEGA